MSSQERLYANLRASFRSELMCLQSEMLVGFVFLHRALKSTNTSRWRQFGPVRSRHTWEDDGSLEYAFYVISF